MTLNAIRIAEKLRFPAPHCAIHSTRIGMHAKFASMKQRYDLLAISLLMFTAVFAVWLSVMPINADALQRWQTLVGGIITALGILVASWNVSRQMRLAARSREQDRIERELPGLRASNFLLARFAIALTTEPRAGRLWKEFESLAVQNMNMADFLSAVIDALPLTPDITKRQAALELFKLRSAVARKMRNDEVLRNAQRRYSAAGELGGDVAERKAQVDEAEVACSTSDDEFEKAIADFEGYRNTLIERSKSEAKKAGILRREHERSLALD